MKLYNLDDQCFETDFSVMCLSFFSKSSVSARSGFIVLLCGSKNLGKSTFARCLVNTLLER